MKVPFVSMFSTFKIFKEQPTLCLLTLVQQWPSPLLSIPSRFPISLNMTKLHFFTSCNSNTMSYCSLTIWKEFYFEMWYGSIYSPHSQVPLHPITCSPSNIGVIEHRPTPIYLEFLSHSFLNFSYCIIVSSFIDANQTSIYISNWYKGYFPTLVTTFKIDATWTIILSWRIGIYYIFIKNNIDLCT